MKTTVTTARPVLLGRFEIALGSQNISYILKRSRRARLVWLQIRGETGLTVTVPHYYDLNELPAYLVSKSRWILRHLNGHPELSRADNAAFKPPLNYRGSPLPAFAEDHHETYRLPDGSTADYSSVLDWLKQQAAVVITARVQQFSPEIGVRYTRISIRDAKTRWGSCSHKGSLNFNWRLIMAPEPVLDYVVIHELCHLKRMNHGKSFWKLVAKYCPDWPEKRGWLNKHSRELHHFQSSSV